MTSHCQFQIIFQQVVDKRVIIIQMLLIEVFNPQIVFITRRNSLIDVP